MSKICPLTNLECREGECAWYLEIPLQNGQEVGKCVIIWLLVLQTLTPPDNQIMAWFQEFLRGGT